MSLCKACEEPLVIRVDDDADGGAPVEAETVPDDLELRCGCHFHWECLMEEASSVATSLKCPSCDGYLPANAAEASSTNQNRQSSGKASILARYSNEGGVQQDLEIMDSLTEETYLQNHPESRPARAFLVMCSKGDIAGAIDLLQDVSGEGHDVGSIVRYQDPLDDMRSGLHLSVDSQQVAMVLTLLWLSSTMPAESFPDLFLRSVEEKGLGRLSVQSGEDIRCLRDCQGRTAEAIARQNPGPLTALLDAGALSP
ncbi:hypothetical protein E4U42_003238 [Claviceps africana]|uniref:Uncharacterized protein n=1 Tax=Claviceps africana TaxID=83212 RepID=A0A8K0J7G5_9HYPO|nr:hypothetical protein E4U42_003238 [Claviceps africana]